MLFPSTRLFPILLPEGGVEGGTSILYQKKGKKAYDLTRKISKGDVLKQAVRESGRP